MIVDTFESMEMISAAEMVSELRMVAPDMPDAMAESLVMDTVIDFTKRTSLLKAWVPIDLQACVSDYFVDLPDCFEINMFHRLCPDGQCACGSTSSVLVRHLPCALRCGTRLVRFASPNTIQVAPEPSTDEKEAFWVEVSATPKRDTCLVPMWLYERHREEIVNGAIWRALRMPNVKWHSMASAREYGTLYNAGVATATLERLLNRTTGQIKMRPKGGLV